MERRRFVSLATAASAATVLASEVSASASESANGIDLNPALQRFLALPGTKSYLIRVGAGGAIAQVAHQPTTFLFTASAFKTFVLGQYLLDVEAGLLSEDEILTIDDQVRNLGSPVFIGLTGEVPAQSVLEAMMSHSDNMATDIALTKVGADRVRATMAQAGLRSTRIPDTTRLFASYIIGAPAGVDLGWPGLKQAYENPDASIRPLLNDVITLAGTARDFVTWYEYVLQGKLFEKPQTLAEFKHIQSTSVQIVEAVPSDTPAYVKGGEVISANGFNAKSFAGQIMVGPDNATPVTFCFLANWNGPPEDFKPVQEEYFASIKDILSTIRQSL